MKSAETSKRIAGKGLKVTPQRIAVLEAIDELHNHPSAEEITDHVRKHYPNISLATVYKVLEAFVGNGIVKKVRSDGDRMRYDAILEKHHHIHFTDSGRIEDFHDEELNRLIEDHLSKRGIPGLEVEGYEVIIRGVKA